MSRTEKNWETCTREWFRQMQLRIKSAEEQARLLKLIRNSELKQAALQRSALKRELKFTNRELRKRGLKPIILKV